jgi:hypothetical protein
MHIVFTGGFCDTGHERRALFGQREDLIGGREVVTRLGEGDKLHRDVKPRLAIAVIREAPWRQLWPLERSG